MDPAQAEFLASLAALPAAGSAERRDAVERFRRAAIRYGSSTDENQQALAQIGAVQSRSSPSAVFGLGLERSGVLLSEILWELEAADIPEAVSARFGAMQPAEWRAALRTSVLILSAFEQAAE
jgi:hypothetical protein